MMKYAKLSAALLVALAMEVHAGFDAARPCNSVQAPLQSDTSKDFNAVLHVQSSETTIGSQVTVSVTADSEFQAVTLNGQLYEFAASKSWTISQKVDCAGVRIVDFDAEIDFAGNKYLGKATKSLGCACGRLTKFCADTTWVLWNNEWPGSQVGSLTIKSKEERIGSTVSLEVTMLNGQQLQKVVVNGYPYTPSAGKITLEGPVLCNGLQVQWYGIELQLADGTSVLTAANKGIGCACKLDNSKPCQDLNVNLYDYNDLSVVLGHVNIHSTKEGKDATEYRVTVEAAPGQELSHIVYNGVDYDPASPQQFAVTEALPCNGFQTLVFQIETQFKSGYVSYLAAFKSIGCRCVNPTVHCKAVETPLFDLFEYPSTLGTANIATKETHIDSEITVNLKSSGKLMVGIIINDYYFPVAPTLKYSVTLDKVPCAGTQLYWLGVGAFYEDGSISVSATAKDIGCKCDVVVSEQCGITEVSMWQWTYPAGKVGTLKISSQESITGAAVSMALDTEPSFRIVNVLLSDSMLAVDHKNHVRFDVAPVSCPKQMIIYPVGIQLEDSSWSLMAAAKWVGCECPK